jgi:hypothetical protein
LENLDLCLPDKNFSLKDQVRSGNRSGKTWPGLIVGLPIGTPDSDKTIICRIRDSDSLPRFSIDELVVDKEPRLKFLLFDT